MHLAFADRYDLFRDELYFIVCGRHPAFGYVDQPPLIPLLAAGGYLLGGHTWIVRLPSVLAAAALVWLVVSFVRLLGGRDGAAWLAGIATGIAPMLLGLSATLNTNAFEPLAWTAVAYGLARAALLDDRRALVWSGVVAGIAMEAKYALPLWLLALGAGIAFFPERRLFRYRELWIGLFVAAVVALPSLVWQATHGLPFSELVRNAHLKDLAVAPAAFVLNQIIVFDPLLAPLWFCGIVAPFFMRPLRGVRFISIAFLLAAVAIVAQHGKDYYLAPAYPSLFAMGATAAERLVKNALVRSVYAAAAVALALIGMPLALPMLPPAALVAYQTRMHLAAAPQERGDAGDSLPSTFADMLGWHDFVREVAAAYDALPARERVRTSIVVDNYGEAAALDIYGGAYALPPALSGHNQYFYFGLRGQSPANVLRVQDQPEGLRPYCAGVVVLGTTKSYYARAFENGKTIAFCRGLHPGLAELWPMLRMII